MLLHRGNPQFIYLRAVQSFFLFWTPSPLVSILARFIVPNSRNLPHYVCIWVPPLPSLCRRHLSMAPYNILHQGPSMNYVCVETSGVTCIMKGCLTLSFLKSTSVRGWAKYSWPIACASQSNASKIQLSLSNASKIHLRKRLRYY